MNNQEQDEFEYVPLASQTSVQRVHLDEVQQWNDTQLQEANITGHMKNADLAVKHAHMIHGTDISMDESQGPLQSYQGSSNDQVLLPGR